MRRLCSRHGESLDACFDAEIYADSLERALSAISYREQHDMLTDLALLYRRAGGLAADADKFDRVAVQISDHADDLIRFVASGFGDYARLVRLWRQLIHAAEELSSFDWSQRS